MWNQKPQFNFEIFSLHPPKNLKLIDFTIVGLWVYLITFISETHRAN
jgi:hypothetical protein